MTGYICSICGKDFPVYCEEDLTIGLCPHCGKGKGKAIRKKDEEVKIWLKKKLKR